MNSLRARLILGLSLIAVLPLGLAMFLFTNRVQRTVREQARERIEATLAGVKHELLTEGGRAHSKLAVFGRDPALKRLLLVDPGPELSEYLAEQRFLLGFDVLVVTDTAGRVIADAANAPSAFVPEDRDIVYPRPDEGVVLRSIAPELAIVASAPIHYQNETVGRVAGGVVIDSVRLIDLEKTSGITLALRGREGRIVVATTPASHTSLVQEIALEPAPSRAAIIGYASTAPVDRVIQVLRTSSILLAVAAVVLAILLGVVWSRQVARPIERLAGFSQRIARGEWDEPLEMKSAGEIETLVAAFERMRRDLRGYRERLVATERHAAWSVMARQVAHEVRNPLTPIAVSVADLQRSYDQGREDFPVILSQAVRTVSEEVRGLKRLLQEFSELGRMPEPAFAPCEVRDLLADLEGLYAHEVGAGRLRFEPAPDFELRADRTLLRQALVNLVKNALEATEGGGTVTVSAAPYDGGAEIAVADTGPGLSAEQRAHLFEPNFTTKSEGSGLGLAIAERIAIDHGGTIAVESEGGRGSTFRLRIPAGGGAAGESSAAEEVRT